MKRMQLFLILVTLLLPQLPALAMEDHADGGHSAAGFKHDTVVDGVRSEFQIMSLASMGMQDEAGRTHHIMVKLFDDQTRDEIRKAVGKIKVIAPDGGEQVNALKNYNGILAANFTFPAKGKYGVICLLKVDGKKKVVKFWYHHQG